MPIQILGVKPDSYEQSDKDAYATAERWLQRIPDLFLTERSYQTAIGISEVGSDCRKCVAKKLAGYPKNPSGSWYPFIGTAVHQALEDGFMRWSDDYMLEERLTVHEYKTLKLGGSCDMAAISISDDNTVIVNDWKVVGDDAIDKARKGNIKNQYRIQAMLYGLGWEKKGYKVSHVSLSFLPRNKDLNDAQVVMLRYEREVAAEALASLEAMIDAAELVGWEAVIAKQPKASFCFDCKRFEQMEMGDVQSLI
jgi:hypothetical protein